MNWFQRQWTDIRGNAKWWLLGGLGTASAGVRTFFWEWFTSASVPVRILLGVVGGETALLILAGIALSNVRKARKGPNVLPLEQQINLAQTPVKRSVSKFTLKDRLAFGAEDKVDSEFAIRVYMDNVDTARIENYRLLLTVLGKWHPVRQEFRQPTFMPLCLIDSVDLEPERSSAHVLLVRLTDLSATELELPTGARLRQRERCRTGGRWQADFNIEGGEERYSQQVVFDWWPGSAPTLVTGRPKQPIIEYPTFSIVGFGDPMARQMGFNAPEGLAFFVRNSETRFPTSALNLRAFLRLRSVDDQEVRIDNAPWFQNLASGPPAHCYKRSVTIGMLESAGIICAIKQNSQFFAAEYGTELAPVTGPMFTYGDWYFDLRIEGDNVWREFKGKVQFLPNGASGFTPPDSVKDN
jgi:hypothetical protein